MNLVEIPSKGDGLRAEWGESVARSINAFGPAASPGSLPFTTPDGHIGFSPLPANRRERKPSAASTLEFAFRLRTGSESDAGGTQRRNFVEMYCTGETSVALDGETASSGSVAGGLAPGESCDLGTAGWQRIHQTEFAEDPESVEKSIFIDIRADGEGNLTWDITDEETDNPVGSVSGNAVSQAAMGFQSIAAKNDGASLDTNGDGTRRELAHFADGKRDSGMGLVQRLKADVETGEITAEDDTIYLVARKNGEIIYIPLSGNGSDPEPDEEAPGSGPCDHPGGGEGSNGGVAAESGSSGGGTTGRDEREMHGGVPAEGDAHPGSPCTSETCG